MLALYRSGRQAEALERLPGRAARAVDELGIEPGPRAQQLHARDPAPGARPRRPRRAGRRRRRARGRRRARCSPAGSCPCSAPDDRRQLAGRGSRERFDYPPRRGARARARRAVRALMRGAGPLYDELHDLFERRRAPTPVHRFFAALPAAAAERGRRPPADRDDELRPRARAGARARRARSSTSSRTSPAGRDRGKFCHVAPDGDARRDRRAERATRPSSRSSRRTVVLKLHGQVDPHPERDWESFVVTEDDYIDYLAAARVATAVPVALAAQLRRSHFLFLGYGMRDWNLRVFLHRLWGDRAAQLPLLGGRSRRPSRSSASSGGSAASSSSRRARGRTSTALARRAASAESAA